MNDFVVIAPYTRNYISVINQDFISSCRKLKIPYKVKYYKSRGSWLVNTWILPDFALETLNKGLNVVLVGADSTFLKYPDYFHNIKADIAYRKYPTVYIFDEEKKIFINNSNKIKAPISGIMYFKSSPRVIEFVKEWISYKPYSLKYNIGEQYVLNAVENKFKDLYIEELPKQYCVMKYHEFSDQDSIMTTWLASRKYRNATH